ncbi:beta-N-acetylhexosaminidase [Muricauda sp. SCSIO 64092]|nr:family 20 glycosylhydrolase [Muricauda sp. SCSIO 64092]UOY04918.1 beta-N-acetylhexosaminidase [Muricauda sp. SCSIO 64092]
MRSATEKGLFYGIQTLRQLVSSDKSISYLEIKDAPRFAWRAFMLDEGRYSQRKKQVLKMLDEMARLKMNVFHWHLVDDQGWRIEIKKYPLLTEIGSKWPSTQVGPLRWNSPIQSGEPHKGFYTQEDIREIVAYAAQRHIVVIPEIEMPRHSSATMAAYPWLGSSGKKIDVPIWFGVSKDVYNIADPKVYGFLTDVLDEVMALFPSKIIHIGGDEAKYDHWESSEYITKYTKENKLKTFADLQVFFTNRISRYLESKGSRIMGGNEILGQNVHDYQAEKDAGAEEELSKSSVIHFWRGDISLMKSTVENGYDIVNSLHSETYLDYSYETIPLKRAYDFEPIPAGLKAKYHNRIKGLGCQMWGEWIPKSGYMDFMIFPRIAAYAEVRWTQRVNKDYEAFKGALSGLQNLAG